ncbi:MAG: SnoaL-like domain-containing protein [Candidatus Latescibacteria bacterium]|nr:SnoaL-like domain-containing protein [Candidatus Latescibacterota bacterium]
MFRLLSLLVVSVLLVTMPNRAMAGDEDDVKAAVVAMFAALDARNADGWIDSHTADCTLFAGGPLGAMLADQNIDPAAMRTLWAQQNADGVPAANTTVSYLQATVIGNMAYTTSYLGFSLLPDATGPPGRWRSTMIWVKQGGKWKRAHYHSSPLYPGQ